MTQLNGLMGNQKHSRGNCREKCERNNGNHTFTYSAISFVGMWFTFRNTINNLVLIYLNDIVVDGFTHLTRYSQCASREQNGGIAAKQTKTIKLITFLTQLYVNRV